MLWCFLQQDLYLCKVPVVFDIFLPVWKESSIVIFFHKIFKNTQISPFIQSIHENLEGKHKLDLINLMQNIMYIWEEVRRLLRYHRSRLTSVFFGSPAKQYQAIHGLFIIDFYIFAISAKGPEFLITFNFDVYIIIPVDISESKIEVTFGQKSNLTL